MHAWTRPRAQAWAAFVLLLLAGTTSAQSLTSQTFKSPTGESVKFLGDSVSLKYYPAASANCSQCYLAFKLGALSELDAFGQPVASHTIADLSQLVPEVTGGQRVSGSVSYHYLTMTFTTPRLPPSLTKSNCPSLESIINQAYHAGVGPKDSDLMAQMADKAAHGGPRMPLPGQPVSELATMSPFGRRLQQLSRFLPGFHIERVIPSSPASSSPPSPPAAAANTASPAPAPAQAEQTGSGNTTQSAAASSDKPAAPDGDKQKNNDSKDPAEKPTSSSQQAPAADSKPDAAKDPKQPDTPQAAAPSTQQKDAQEDIKKAPAAADAPDAAKDAKQDTPAPQEDKKVEIDTKSGVVPIPAEKDDDDTSKEAPAAAPTPAPVPVPTVTAPVVQPAAPAAAPALTPVLPPVQAADQFHQQLAANNGYLPDPAASAGQAWGAYPGGGNVQYGGMLFGDAPPVLKVTFMFGFSGNKTFAYGRNRVVSAPAGSLKYTIEAHNWPFCSLYNSLKLEVVMASTMKEAQPQFVLSDAADIFQDMDSMRGPATRRLQQARIHQAEAFTDFMDADTQVLRKKAAAGMASNGLDMLDLATGPTKRVATAKLLVGPKLAAATEFPTYAFSSDRFTSESNVSVVLAANNKDAARFSLQFGYFEQGLFYDPTVFFSTNTEDMMLGSDGAAAAALPPSRVKCAGNETECGRGRRRPTMQNSSSRAGGALWLQTFLSAAAMLAAVLLL